MRQQETLSWFSGLCKPHCGLGRGRMQMGFPSRDQPRESRLLWGPGIQAKLRWSHYACWNCSWVPHWVVRCRVQMSLPPVTYLDTTLEGPAEA